MLFTVSVSLNIAIVQKLIFVFLSMPQTHANNYSLRRQPIRHGIFEVRSVDGRVSHFLAWVCSVVSFGVEFCPVSFARNKSAFKKMIDSDR